MPNPLNANEPKEVDNFCFVSTSVLPGYQIMPTHADPGGATVMKCLNGDLVLIKTHPDA